MFDASTLHNCGLLLLDNVTYDTMPGKIGTRFA